MTFLNRHSWFFVNSYNRTTSTSSLCSLVENGWRVWLWGNLLLPVVHSLHTCSSSQAEKVQHSSQWLRDVGPHLVGNVLFSSPPNEKCKGFISNPYRLRPWGPKTPKFQIICLWKNKLTVWRRCKILVDRRWLSIAQRRPRHGCGRADFPRGSSPVYILSINPSTTVNFLNTLGTTHYTTK